MDIDIKIFGEKYINNDMTIHKSIYTKINGYKYILMDIYIYTIKDRWIEIYMDE